MESETCFVCDEHTGRAGRSDDSLFDRLDRGPYCPDCWEHIRPLVRVRIVGDHPWSGYTGTALAISRPKPEAKLVREPLVRIRLDRGQNCQEDHECYAGKGEIVLLDEAR